MKTINIKISELTVAYIERLSYEVNAYETIITHLINNKSIDISYNKNFDYYNEKYQDTVRELNIAKNEVVNTMIPKQLLKHKLSWNINFLTNMIEITVQCNCFDNMSNEEFEELITHD